MAVVLPFNSRTILGLNQEAYQQLRLAAGLRMRRQLMFAVCDDVALQYQLALRLVEDLETAEQALPQVQAQAQGQAKIQPLIRPGSLITLQISPEQPSLLRPILDWFKAESERSSRRPAAPLFQFLGIEQLTCQSPAIQNRFLASLSRLEVVLARLDVSLLLWLPRPWMQKIRQCVPSFWRLRNGLFEFAGEPVQGLGPVPTFETRLDVRAKGSTPQRLKSTRASLWDMLEEDLAILEAPPGSKEEFTPVRPATASALSVAEPADVQSPSHARPASEAAATAQIEGLTYGNAVVGAEPLETAADEGTQEHLASPLALVDSSPEEIPWANSAISAQWRQIQMLKLQQAGPLTLARAYLGLGQCYRSAIEAGNTQVELLDLAIEAYQEALARLNADSGEWCDGLNDLGGLYWLRSQVETQPETVEEWLQRSIQAYQEALTASEAVLSIEARARINSNLGTAYSLLANLQTPKEHLTQAVRAYHRALSVRPADTHPGEYAGLQNSLGAVHWRLAQLGEARDHLHQAITAYREALSYQHPQDLPREYAMLQNNLGIAYWSLAQYERPDFFLEQAILAYQAALAYRTLAADPAGCAATHNNLGTAYWDLAQRQSSPEQQLTLWQQAAIAYEAALEAAQRSLEHQIPLSFDVGATDHSVGVVYDHVAQRLTDVEQARSILKQALDHYLQALEGWQARPDRQELILTALAHNVRLHFQILGSTGQQAALSQVPAALLPEILPQL